jgi:hypothetical protein
MTLSAGVFLGLAICWGYTVVASVDLKNFTLEFLLEGLPDIVDDPELALLLVVCLLVIWAAIAILRKLIDMVVSLFSGDWGDGPQGLGLS